MSNFKCQISNVKFQTLAVMATVLLLFTFITQPVYAAHCNQYRGKAGPHAPNDNRSASTMTGNECTNLAPSDFSTVLECRGAAGYRYNVTYCTGDQNVTYSDGSTQHFEAGCEEKYPQEGQGTAPAACNRPDSGQSKIGEIFGQINAPLPIQQLGFGALGISTFLTNLVALIYSLAIVVLIFMVLWGAWDWLTSEGDKEKLESAKRKLVNAFIGIILFAIAFAAIRILGIFTGFKFFVGQ